MFTLNCKGRLLVIKTPVIMGIINTAPDSFYEGSRFHDPDTIVEQAEKMHKQGALLVDVGGQSTRPGSRPAGIEEELKRVIPAIHSIHTHVPELFISVDTYHAIVAKEAVAAGADIVNDISGGNFDEGMLATVAGLTVPFICMHVKGDAVTMHKNPVYENILLEVVDYFVERIAACRLAGINDVIIDPGFGFSKNIPHNFQLLGRMKALTVFEKPVLTGFSRKSTIYKTLDITPEEALNGTTVMNTISLLQGADILRVHDVREAVEAVTLVSAFQRFST